MACGIPVVASPVGTNADIVAHGGNGFLAKSTEGWVAMLRTLIADAGLRDKLGAAGRETVEKHFTVQRAAEQVASVLRDVV
jgi:glycosyltransferase involved in cell wall biosynthesis